MILVGMALKGKTQTPLEREEKRMLGTRLRQIRLARGWSQRDMARICGVDHAWISRLEAGERHNISLAAAMKIAKCAGVSLDYLAGATNDPTPPALRYTLLGDAPFADLQPST